MAAATIDDGAIGPMLDLRVAVTKREPAGVVVIGGGAINPPVVAGNIEKVPVVDAPRILIEEEPEIGGAWHRQIGRLDVNAIPRPVLVSGGGIGGGVDPGIHGHAAEAVCATAACGINGASVISAWVGGAVVRAGAADMRI